MSEQPVSAAQLALDGAGYVLGAQADQGRPIQLVHQILSLDERIAKGEELLKLLKEQRRLLVEDHLPDAMLESGVEKLVVDGHSVEAEQIVTGSIPDVRAPEACAWLRDHGHGQLVQHTFTINTKRKEDEAATRLRTQLAAQGFEYKEKETVNHMSLKAWAREQIQRGVALPYDLLGLWVGRRAVIKPVKEK